MVENHILGTDALWRKATDLFEDGAAVGRVHTWQLLDLFEFALAPPAVIGPGSEDSAAEADIDNLLLQCRTLRRGEVRTTHTRHFGALEPAGQLLDPVLGHDDVVISEHH